MESQTHNRRGGFTLLELLIVGLVMSVMAAVAVPAMMPQRLVTNQGAQVLASAMMQAQRMAVTEQHDVVLAFHPREPVARLHLDRDQDRRIGPNERTMRVDLDAQVEWGLRGAKPRPEDGRPPITFKLRQDGWPAVVFRRNGSASEAGAVYLNWRRGDARDARLVVLTRATGRPTIHAWGDAGWRLMRSSR